MEALSIQILNTHMKTLFCQEGDFAEPFGSAEDRLPSSQHEPPARIDERRDDLADQIFDRQDPQPRIHIPIRALSRRLRARSDAKAASTGRPT